MTLAQKYSLPFTNEKNGFSFDQRAFFIHDHGEEIRCLFVFADQPYHRMWDFESHSWSDEMFDLKLRESPTLVFTGGDLSEEVSKDELRDATFAKHAWEKGDNPKNAVMFPPETHGTAYGYIKHAIFGSVLCKMRFDYDQKPHFFKINVMQDAMDPLIKG